MWNNHAEILFLTTETPWIRHLTISIVAGLVVRHGDLSHEITLSHEGRIETWI